jgi:fructose-1,6-bisphosphatase I
MKGGKAMRFEQTFMDFLLQHQERHNRTYHFLILMEGLINAAKHIQHYYLTGALKGNLGLAGDVNVQGEDVMRMDQIAHEVTIHYLKATGRVIHAISEEAKEILPLNPEGGRYLVYFDPGRLLQCLTAFPWVSFSASPSGTSVDLRMVT